MVVGDELSPEERETVELAAELCETGDLHPLVERLRDGLVGPERARDALRVLAEADPDLLVQITLDGLIGAYLQDPGLAHQPHRVVRGNEIEGQTPGRE